MRPFALPADLSTRAIDSAARTNPVSVDADGDELPDNVEIRLGTDPANPDTDGDALLDGWEVYGVNGLDLSELATTPNEWSVLVFNGGTIGKQVEVGRLFSLARSQYQKMREPELSEQQRRKIQQSVKQP